MSAIRFEVGDCLEVFGAEPDDSFDAFVADLPAGVNFMSRAWDGNHGHRDRWIAFWAERLAMAYRKAKPGAYAFFWALPRTAGWTHRAIEDAGWFVQDCVIHCFGQGWPKGQRALKPASEHWILARKGAGGPLQIDAARVARGEPISADLGAMGYGQGGERVKMPLNTAGSWPPNFALSHCPECEERGTRWVTGSNGVRGKMSGNVYNSGLAVVGQEVGYASPDGTETVPAFDCLAACDCGASVLAPSGGEPPRCVCGRAMWWACPVAEMDAQSGERASGGGDKSSDAHGVCYSPKAKDPNGRLYEPDSGGASRFFPRFTYAAKASGGERHAGCDHLLWRADKRSSFGFVRVTREEWDALPAGTHDTVRAAKNEYQQPARVVGNVHPTVKSLALMEWLVSLVLPPGGRLGDVTCGSGGTLLAVDRLNVSRSLGASALGCDICPEAIEIAQARLAWWRANTAVQAGLFGEATVIEPEPVRLATPKPRPAKPAPAPKVDPRQDDLFAPRGGT